MPEQTSTAMTEAVGSMAAPRDDTIQLGDNALTVLRRRYLLRDPDGQPIERPAEMFWRVARVAAAPDGVYGEDADASAQAYYEMLSTLRFLPNSPTFTGAGTPLGQLAACFVLPIRDDMGRDPAGIFSTLRVAALIQQTGGGNGFSFSQIRPRGARVNSSKGVATGPVGFLRVYDKAFGEIAQGGTRRGANMAVLRVDHPDILDFVRCKSEEGDITNFNISVGITDAFMRAVEADSEFDLVNPQDGSVWTQIPAREVFDEIVECSHRNGEHANGHKCNYTPAGQGRTAPYRSLQEVAEGHHSGFSFSGWRESNGSTSRVYATAGGYFNSPIHSTVPSFNETKRRPSAAISPSNTGEASSFCSVSVLPSVAE